jgi:hypothetical protein
MASRKELVGALGALIRRLDHTDRIEDLRNGGVLDNARRVLASAEKGIPAPLPWTPLERVPHGKPTEREIASLAKSQGFSEEQVRETFDRIIAEEALWQNASYMVSRRDIGDGGVHLSIKRIDQQPIHDWRDLQRIKNELIGPDCEAVELYPAEGRRVDTANQYHLWGTADPEFRFGFGFTDRMVTEGDGSHLQRAGAEP